MGGSLVGRDSQQEQISAWLAARTSSMPAARASSVENTPPALFISGDAGIGKTALVQTALARAAFAADASGGDASGGDAFGGYVLRGDVFGGEAIGEVGLGEVALGAKVQVRRAAAVPWHPVPYGVLDQIVPGVVRSDRPGAIEVDAVRAALLEAGHPLVIILDDLHWADSASLDVLAPMIDALAGDPVAVIGAYRAEELPRGHLLRRVRAQLRHRRQLSEIALGPLEPPALRELIEAVLAGKPTPALAAAVAERTEGVPFFVEELLAALRAAGWLVPDGDRIGLAAAGDLPLPDSVRDAVLLRSSGLPEPSRRALDLAAVLGAEFDVATVAALNAGGWPDDLDHCGLINSESDGQRRFRHVLAQEAVYSEVPWSRRRALHLAVADRLAETGGAPAVVARHLMAGHDLERARPALVTAAEEHLRAHAYRDAAYLLGTALETWPLDVDESGRLTVVDQLARCAELSGDHARAVANLRELADRRAGNVSNSASSNSASSNIAEVHRRLAVQYELLGHWPLALAAREAAADAYADADCPGEAATERLTVATHLRSAASFRASLDMLDAAETSAQVAGRNDLISRIGGVRGNVLTRMGRADEGLATVRSALDLALAHGLDAPAAEIYQRLADSLEHAGDYRGAGRAYDTAYEFCQTHDQGVAGALCRACVTVVLFQGGRWSRATKLCAEVLSGSLAPAHARSVASGVLGLVRAMRGQVDARASLLESQTTAGRIDLVAMELLSTWGLAVLDETAGRSDHAIESYRHVVARSRATEERHYCIPVLQFAVSCFARAGAMADLGDATAVLADAVATTGQPDTRAAFAYALGESALLQSGPDDALPHLRRSLDILNDLDLPIADMLVRHRTAVTLAATGPEVLDEALEMLRDAQRTAHRLKARPLLETIRADLDRIGGRPADSSSPDALLTAREMQVLRLVGDGLTSRDIGQRLFLSVRTVDMHVGNGVAKLGCRTRAEAVRRLAATDLR